MAKDNLLTFKEFSDRSSGIPRYNNLFLHFLEAEAEEDMQVYRFRSYFQRFQREHPNLEKSLTEEMIKKLNDPKTEGRRSEPLREFDRDLYKAYKIMRNYGASNVDLFS